MRTPPSKPGAEIYAPCVAISQAMINHFTTRLEVEAGKAGGALNGDAIRAIAERFLSEEHARFAPTFQRSWDGCSAIREERQWESSRHRPFDRILTKKFSHLFPPRQGEVTGDAPLSRRLLPGFHMAVDKMIGPALYQQCQRKSQGILDRHRRTGGNIDWEGVHADTEARALADDVLTVVAHSFTAFEHRRGWFIDLINGHLAAPTGGTGDAFWRMTENGFNELMRALFADLRNALATDPRALGRRYGESTVLMIESFFRRIDGIAATAEPAPAAPRAATPAPAPAAASAPAPTPAPAQPPAPAAAPPTAAPPAAPPRTRKRNFLRKRAP